MLNYRSKPSQDSIFIEIAIWGADLVLCSAPEFGPHPGGSYGGQGGLSFFVGAKGRQWSQISHRKLKISISHDVVILASEPDAMLKGSEPDHSVCTRAPHYSPLGPLVLRSLKLSRLTQNASSDPEGKKSICFKLRAEFQTVK